MDITPSLPDLTNDGTRRASLFTIFHNGSLQAAMPLSQLTVMEMCDYYSWLKEQVPTPWNAAWITAIEQELEYRASRHAYETQTQGHTDRLG